MTQLGDEMNIFEDDLWWRGERWRVHTARGAGTPFLAPAQWAETRVDEFVKGGG